MTQPLMLALDTCTDLASIALYDCLLYTSDAADERSSVDLGGRRIIKKKKIDHLRRIGDNYHTNIQNDESTDRSKAIARKKQMKNVR